MNLLKALDTSPKIDALMRTAALMKARCNGLAPGTTEPAVCGGEMQWGEPRRYLP